MVTVSSEYRNLPTAEDLPDSDETPVDNELQNDIPNMLLNLLRDIWADRSDWFWGVDMGIYYEPNIEEPAKSKVIVPDGFLALGVPRDRGEGGRLSYVLWQEQVLPILVLEVVSQKYNGEYDTKFKKYEALGILYYVIYNFISGRRGLYKSHQSLEVYKLVDGKYELVPSVALLPDGKMIWLPEVGLGIGCELGNLGSWRREWMYWYDRSGVKFPTAQERVIRAEAIAQQERIIANQEKIISQQERLAKEQLEEILKKYRDRFGEIPV